MKENNQTQVSETRKVKAHQGRWSRDVDGALRYRGICPFNRNVCRLMNAITQVKSGRKAV